MSFIQNFFYHGYTLVLILGSATGLRTGDMMHTLSPLATPLFVLPPPPKPEKARVWCLHHLRVWRLVPQARCCRADCLYANRRLPPRALHDSGTGSSSALPGLCLWLWPIRAALLPAACHCWNKQSTLGSFSFQKKTLGSFALRPYLVPNFFCKIDTVALSFVFDKYCLIID